MLVALACANDILQVVFLGGGVLVAVFLFLQLAPKIRLSITARWPSQDPKVCILNVTFSNESRVRIKTKEVLLCVSFHPAPELRSLTEWVEFDDSTERICKTTEYLYPGETVSVERPLVFPTSETVAHVGLKFRTALSWFGAVVSRVRNRKVDWTTTAFIVPRELQMNTENNQQPSAN